jgi:hypothetical protein
MHSIKLNDYVYFLTRIEGVIGEYNRVGLEAPGHACGAGSLEAT